MAWGARWEASRHLLGDLSVHGTLNPPLRVPLLLSPTPNRDGPKGDVRRKPLSSLARPRAPRKT